MNILLINGGRGATSFINYFKNKKKYNIYSIVNAYDDGKSTGTIRNFFKILGPSDIRKVQSLFLDNKNKNYKNYKNFFEFRFDSNISNYEAKLIIQKILNFKNNKIINFNKISKHRSKKIYFYLKIFFDQTLKIENKDKILFNFQDCSIINCLYAGAIIHFKRNIEKAIEEITNIFEIKHKVFVNSNSERFLTAIRANGEVLVTEKDIVEIRSNQSIEEIYLLKKKISKYPLNNYSINYKKNFLKRKNFPPNISQKLKKIINNATYIIFCPGTQHSSLYPTYLTKNFLSILLKSSAKKIFISNIGADYETPFYNASDYVLGAMKYLNKYSAKKIKNIFDIAFFNKPLKANKNYVALDYENIKKLNIKYIIDNFEDIKKNGHHDAKKIFQYLNI